MIGNVTCGQVWVAAMILRCWFMLLQSDTYLYGDILTMCLQVRTLDDACVFFLASLPKETFTVAEKGFQPVQHRTRQIPKGEHWEGNSTSREAISNMCEVWTPLLYTKFYVKSCQKRNPSQKWQPNALKLNECVTCSSHSFCRQGHPLGKRQHWNTLHTPHQRHLMSFCVLLSSQRALLPGNCILLIINWQHNKIMRFKNWLYICSV